MLDIDFSLQLVRDGAHQRHVTNPDGTPTSSGNVNLMPEQAAAAAAGRSASTSAAASSGTARSSISNVPPGRYMLRARGDDTETPQFAAQPISVDSGGDIDDVTVVLSFGRDNHRDGLVPAGGQATPDITQVRITAPSTDPPRFGRKPNARVDKDGELHARRRVGRRASDSVGRRSSRLDAEIGHGRRPRRHRHADRGPQRRDAANVSVVFTDKLSEINGTRHRHAGHPVTEYTVLAFPDRCVVVAAAVAADHDGAARPDRQVPGSAACRPATTTWSPSIRPNRANGSSRRISTSTASARRA